MSSEPPLAYNLHDITTDLDHKYEGREPDESCKTNVQVPDTTQLSTCSATVCFLRIEALKADVMGKQKTSFRLKHSMFCEICDIL